jgi:hypothetical protein
VSGLGVSTVIDFERERRQVSEDAVAAIRTAIEKAGVEFTVGGQPGVKLRQCGKHLAELQLSTPKLANTHVPAKVVVEAAAQTVNHHPLG